MDVIAGPLIKVLLMALDIYMWIIIIQVILSWLVAFNVINTSNKFVYMVGDFTYKATEPVMRPIRNVLPNLGGIDISPLVVILIIFFIQQVLVQLLYKVA